MEIVKAEIDANYDDRKVLGDRIEITTDHMNRGCALIIRAYLSNERKDDYTTITVDIADLLEAVGKEVTRHYGLQRD